MALLRLLHQGTWDLRGLDPVAFHSWLDRHLARWRSDPVFVQRAAIRDLRARCPDLEVLEARLRRAEATDRESSAFARWSVLEREIDDAAKAIDGMGAALEETVAARRQSLADKLDRFRARHAELSRERESLLRVSPERRELLRVREELEALRADIGLDRAEVELERLQRQRGHGSGRSGAKFEDVALELSREVIVPDVAARHALDPASDRIAILRGVKLGASATELDQVVVLRDSDPAVPARVLAVVEVKRNINDLGHGFQRRQQNLAWLCGETGRYDPDALRTRAFPTGHFDRPAAHPHGPDTVVLDASSFSGLVPDPASGHFLQDLWFVTREGPLWGADGAALSRIAHRVSSDARWDPGDERYLVELLHWCRSLTHPVEAPDVLGLYAHHAEAADRVLVVGPTGPDS